MEKIKESGGGRKELSDWDRALIDAAQLLGPDARSGEVRAAAKHLMSQREKRAGPQFFNPEAYPERSFERLVEESFVAALGREIPVEKLEPVGRVRKFCSSISGQSPEEQVLSLTEYFYDTNRPGGDCDAYGSWQPGFIKGLIRRIGETFNVPYNLPPG